MRFFNARNRNARVSARLRASRRYGVLPSVRWVRHCAGCSTRVWASAYGMTREYPAECDGAADARMARGMRRS
jgi:hypothetical protein